jgi:hypothetical protein
VPSRRRQKEAFRLNDLAGYRVVPFRASEAHRLPKSAAYVSAQGFEVKE